MNNVFYCEFIMFLLAILECDSPVMARGWARQEQHAIVYLVLSHAILWNMFDKLREISWKVITSGAQTCIEKHCNLLKYNK